MREVVVYELLSLDGVAEAPETFFADWDEEMDANLGAVIATQDTVVLGRRSHDEWAAFWPTSDLEPFATFINTVPKLVATSTALDVPWTAATAIDGDLVEAVRELRAGSGGGIGVHASISVARSLLAAGVVDRLRLVVFPAVVGSGRRLLDGLPPLRLTTLEARSTPSGSLLLDYRVEPPTPG